MVAGIPQHAALHKDTENSCYFHVSIEALIRDHMHTTIVLLNLTSEEPIVSGNTLFYNTYIEKFRAYSWNYDCPPPPPPSEMKVVLLFKGNRHTQLYLMYIKHAYSAMYITKTILYFA